MRIVALLLAFAVRCSFAASTISDNADVKGAERFFEAWIQGQIAYRGLPGIAVGVIHDQELVWAKGFGYADVDLKTPVTPSTKFRMASHSKLFTATAIMQLRDAGKVHLDDPVEKYLPWFKVQPLQAGDLTITLEELLTHSAGLPREAGPHWSELSFPDAAGVQKFIATHPVPYSPEIRWKYSNLGFTIAGMVVEAVSGGPWANYVQTHIFDPLGMASSSVDKPVEGLATGYGRRMPDGTRAKMPFVDARSMAAATGITSTVEDMAKFVSLQFRSGAVGGSQILSTGALRQMHRVRMLENNWERGNAIGFAVSRYKGKVYIGHGGSYPGYKTQTFIQLDSKVGVVVLTNGDDSNASDIADHLMQSVGEAVAKTTEVHPSNLAWNPAWSRFAGIYRSRNSDSQVVELNQRLVLLDPSGPFPEHPGSLVPIGDDKFRLEADTGGAPVGETVRFIEKDGRMRMYTGESYADRVQ